MLRKTSLDFENEGVLNPAVISDGDHIHVFYRAVSKGNYSTIGYCKLKGPLIIEESIGQAPFFRNMAMNRMVWKIPELQRLMICTISHTLHTTESNALGALAVSKDLKHFDKLGLIVPRIRL